MNFILKIQIDIIFLDKIKLIRTELLVIKKKF